jgi:hypothetical protein
MVRCMTFRPLSTLISILIGRLMQRMDLYISAHSLQLLMVLDLPHFLLQLCTFFSSMEGNHFVNCLIQICVFEYVRLSKDVNFYVLNMKICIVLLTIFTFYRKICDVLQNFKFIYTCHLNYAEKFGSKVEVPLETVKRLTYIRDL